MTKEIVLVTGAAGFIGSVLTRELYKRGESSLIVVDRQDDGTKWLNLRGIPLESYYNADHFWAQIPESTWPKIKAIFHIGACSSTTEMNVDFLMKNNFEFSQRLWLKASEYKIPFVYASSAATYGGGELGYDDDHAIVSKLLPLNPYGHSKQLFDQWFLKKLAEKNNFPCYGVKFFNVYGPNEYHKDSMRSVVVQAFEQIQKEGKVRLFESHKEGIAHGHQKRDFVYVKDVVGWMIDLWQLNQASASGIYNMGSGKARTFEDLALATFAATGRKPQIEFVPMPEHLRSQYQYFTEAKMNKLFKVIGKDQATSLEAGVKDYVQNYLSQDFRHH